MPVVNVIHIKRKNSDHHDNAELHENENYKMSIDNKKEKHS
jgi:hypothetical protein